MDAKLPLGLFVTGTSTAVGKTYVAAAIARALHAAGCRVGIYKPVLSGCAPLPSTEDAIAASLDDDVVLWRAAGQPGELIRVCPQRFHAPLAPHLAARAEGRSVDTRLLRSGIEYWRQSSDFVLVEGAGGLLSPVHDDQYAVHIAADLGLPLVVVAVNSLGAINQTLQTLAAARLVPQRLPVAALVLNHPHSSPDPAGPWDEFIADANGDELRTRLTTPVVLLRHQALDFVPQVDWLQLAAVAGEPAIRGLSRAARGEGPGARSG